MSMSRSCHRRHVSLDRPRPRGHCRCSCPQHDMTIVMVIHHTAEGWTSIRYKQGTSSLGISNLDLSWGFRAQQARVWIVLARGQRPSEVVPSIRQLLFAPTVDAGQARRVAHLPAASPSLTLLQLQLDLHSKLSRVNRARAGMANKGLGTLVRSRGPWPRVDVQDRDVADDVESDQSHSLQMITMMVPKRHRRSESDRYCSSSVA